jgi:simple sugar transport system ATP-binding protein
VNNAAAPALHFAGITKSFGGVKALDQVSFEVQPGEVHCLAGENGCGKTTLIKTITGVYTPDSAERMAYFGTAVSHVTPLQARRFGIDVIWQDLALFPQMSVAENIAIEGFVGGRPRLVKRHALREKAAGVLARLGMTLDLDAPLKSLSIAERQVVAVSRALMGEARLVFMDEPTASLTQSETDKLLAIVRKLSDSGVAVVFVSHRLAEVLKIASRVTVLRDGRLVGVYSTAGMTPSRLTELMTGKTFDHAVVARDRSAAKPVLEVEDLTRAGEFEGVSLTVREGEVLGIIGLIGAGRTELAHTLFGMTPAQRGRIRLLGRDVRFGSNREAIAAGIAYLSEDRLTLGLIQPQSIADNTVITVLDRILDATGLTSATKQHSLVAHWISELAIKIGAPGDAVSTLSGGNQQRIALAKWLATEPKLLILDSPTVGVDVGARAGIFDIVRKLGEQGLAIVLISDEVPEVFFNADRVLQMAAGRIVRSFDPRTSSLREIEEAVYA